MERLLDGLPEMDWNVFSHSAAMSFGSVRGLGSSARRGGPRWAKSWALRRHWFGRRTWQAMAAAWPDRAGDPFADRMNEIGNYVASRTLSARALELVSAATTPTGVLICTYRPVDR